MIQRLLKHHSGVHHLLLNTFNDFLNNHFISRDPKYVIIKFLLIPKFGIIAVTITDLSMLYSIEMLFCKIYKAIPKFVIIKM